MLVGFAGRISSVPPKRARRLSLSPRGTSGERAGERGSFILLMLCRGPPLSSGWWYRQNAQERCSTAGLAGAPGSRSGVARVKRLLGFEVQQTAAVQAAKFVCRLG